MIAFTPEAEQNTLTPSPATWEAWSKSGSSTAHGLQQAFAAVSSRSMSLLQFIYLPPRRLLNTKLARLIARPRKAGHSRSRSSRDPE